MSSALRNVRAIGRVARAIATLNPGRRVRRFYEIPNPEVQFLGRKTRYVNIGYWGDGAGNADDAGEALAAKLAEAARFTPDDVVLDVGCGYGDQDFAWLRDGLVGKVHGLEITPRHVAGARRRAVDEGLGDRVEFQEGSATELPFPDGTFDRVVSLDAALHFYTRDDFFREAMRVLRPGGLLATVDTVPLDGATSRAQFQFEMFRFYRMSVAQENWYSRDVYADKLAEAGFVDARVRSIRAETWEGWYRHHLDNANDPSFLAELPPSDARTIAERWSKPEMIKRELDLLDSVVAVASKPGGPGAPGSPEATGDEAPGRT